MTRERIAEGLELLALQLTNSETSMPAGWAPCEWAAIKGIACNAIWTTRARFVIAGQV
jgi:hypothetical protein